MRNLFVSDGKPPAFADSVRACFVGLFCLGILIFATKLLAQSAPNPAEEAALKILNDSPWARAATPTLQDKPCSYKNPALPSLYPPERVPMDDELAPVEVTKPVKPDNSEYLIRFQSARTVQAAIQQLLAMGGKWSAYGYRKFPIDKEPTDLTTRRYNVGDMITIAVILKRPSSDSANLFEYAYQEGGRAFSSHSFHVWPCAGLKTANGQVFAHLVPGAFPDPDGTQALQLSFPREVNGKPLVSSSHERVEFRMVATQRVFEATFFVEPSDILEGSESFLYLPSAFTDLGNTGAGSSTSNN